MKTRFNNDITKYFSHLNKMIFVYLHYTIFGDFFFFFFGLFLSLGFSPPFSQISIDADHLTFFPSRRVASTKLIVFMYVNRF